MMGTREKMGSADEYDALSKARRFVVLSRGEVRKLKRQFWKRTRQTKRTELRSLIAELADS